jgi:cathepsin L
MFRAISLAAVVAAVSAKSVKTTTAKVLAETNYEYTFEAYAAEFGKVYESEVVRSKREEAFSANLAKIKAHNSQTPAPSWTMGVNQFADLTSAEFKAMTKGRSKPSTANLDQPDGLSAEERATFQKHHANDVSVDKLPDSVDWRTKGVVSAVKNQGGCGSCWAFSTAETVESALAIATGKPPLILSEEELVDCMPNPDACGGTGGCEGATQPEGFAFVSKNGMASEQGYPYTAHDGKCKNFTPEVLPGAIASYVALPTNNYTALMNAVANVGPIAISADAEPWQLYEGGVFSNKCGSDIDHAIQLVGYGSAKEVFKAKDYWLVRNSWGATWGEKGYIRIERFGGGSEPCAEDTTPGDGFGCKNGPAKIQVCGLCGLMSGSSYPVVAKPPSSPPAAAEM